MNFAARVLTIGLLLAAFALPASARRLALVIGNNTYKYTASLKNARNDADLMARTLQAAGFAVTRANDLDRETFFKTIDSFVMMVGKDDEAVFYYAGHGVQIDSSPYLLPVDIRAENARQLVRDALPLDALLSDLSRARYALVVVDACRNNPFAEAGRRGVGAERGLQPIEPPEGIAVIMSAGRGQTALDSLGAADRAGNGLFTREFVRQMQVPGVPVRDLLLKVRDSVEQQAATVAHKQRPALIDESRGQFYFFAPANLTFNQPPGTDAAAVELAYWNSVQERGGVEELKLYLQRYPAGVFADLAQARIARLQSNSQPTANPSVASGGDAEARRLFELAGKGNAGAMTSLGNYYRDGLHELPRDYAQARQWFEKGAQLGNLNALSGMATLYEHGMGVAADPARAVAMYKQAAEGGDARGMNNLGAAYSQGIGGLPKDDKVAFEWYQRAVASGNSYAMANIGAQYLNGRGVARDEAEALRWIRKSADVGGPLGMRLLADMYMGGRLGLTRDFGKAQELYRRAVAGADVASMNGLGTLYLNGWGVARDDRAAAEWFRKAMDLRDPRGIANIAFMYETGRGGYPQDLSKAREMYEHAVDLNDAKAMYQLARFHAENLAGLPRDRQKALDLWTRAAERGYSSAMVQVAALYAEGRDVPQDMQRARQWYERAASQGDDKARKALQSL